MRAHLRARKVKKGFGGVLRAPWEVAVSVLALCCMVYIGGHVLSFGKVASKPTTVNQLVDMQFGVCSGPVRVSCVVDGDTLWVEGTKIRIADIDTPEVSNPQCGAERILGLQATARLVELINQAPFEIAPYERDQDVYGRALRILQRNGRSLGGMLVNEGLAHRWDGARRSWCG